MLWKDIRFMEKYYISVIALKRAGGQLVDGKENTEKRCIYICCF